MRILIVAPSFGEFGGVEAFMFRLAEAVSAEPDVEVSICFKRVSTFQMRPSLEQAVADLDTRVVFVDRASRALLARMSSADLIHSQNPSIDVAIAAAVLRKPHVMTIHGWRRPSLAPRAILSRLAARLPDRRLYNSDFVWSTWEPDGRRPTSAKLPIVSNLPSGPLDPSERKGFVFVGRWVPNKGIDVLIDAYAAASLDRESWPLVLMGDGPLRPALQAEIADRHIQGIEVTGYVDDATRNDRIRRAKWLVAPPHTNEELGLTPIEARSVGVPCIVTRDGGVLEAAGLFSLSCEPRNVDQLRRLLEYAASMEEQTYRRISSETQEELADYLQPMEVYVDLYRELVSSAR